MEDRRNKSMEELEKESEEMDRQEQAIRDSLKSPPKPREEDDHFVPREEQVGYGEKKPRFRIRRYL